MSTTNCKTETPFTVNEASEETSTPVELTYSANLNQLIRECEQRMERRARENFERSKPNIARAPYGLD